MPNLNKSDLSFAFKDNWLTISRNGDRLYNLTVWPKPRAGKYSQMEERTPYYPPFQVISYPLRAHKTKTPDQQLELGFVKKPSVATTKKEAYEALRKTMPYNYAIALAPFRSHQWNLIILLSMKRRFYDLLKANPVLAYCLANNKSVMSDIFKKKLMMETLTGMPQADLLKLLWLPSSKSMVKMLRKIAPASAFPELPEALRMVAESEERSKILAHLKKINVGALKLACLPDLMLSHITPQLMEEVASDRSGSFHTHTYCLFREIYRLNRELHPERAFPKISRTEQLIRLGDELADTQRDLDELAEVRRQQREHLERQEILNRQNEILRRLAEIQEYQPDGTLPSPPFEGTPHIRPLCTLHALKEEGKSQHNCVGVVHAARCLAGEAYLYQVLFPERATLEIRTNSQGWTIGELKGTCNKTVQRETLIAVQEWLASVQLGIMESNMEDCV